MQEFARQLGVLWLHRDLSLKLAYREVSAKYKGSHIGKLWLLIQQFFLVATYTLVFGTIFKSKWGDQIQGGAELAVMIYSGLIIFNLISEILNRSTTILQSNVNYIKKIVFPIEVLPASIVISSLYNFCIGILIAMALSSFLWSGPSLAYLFIPLAVIPILLMSLGFSYLLSATSLYIRDVEQVTQFLTSLLLFLTPIFYPIEAIPEQYRQYMKLNPISYAVETTRAILVYGTTPSVYQYVVQIIMGCLILWIGMRSFERLKRGFGDVA